MKSSYVLSPASLLPAQARHTHLSLSPRKGDSGLGVRLVLGLSPPSLSLTITSPSPFLNITLPYILFLNITPFILSPKHNLFHPLPNLNLPCLCYSSSPYPNHLVLFIVLFSYIILLLFLAKVIMLIYLLVPVPSTLPCAAVRHMVECLILDLTLPEPSHIILTLCLIYLHAFFLL